MNTWGGVTYFKVFLKDLNEFHPNMKFTYETSQNDVDFLDLNVSLNMVQFPFKSKDGHQFLHFKASHLSHIKNSIPYNQALRISRPCSSQNDFNAHISK